MRNIINYLEQRRGRDSRRPARGSSRTPLSAASLCDTFFSCAPFSLRSHRRDARVSPHFTGIRTRARASPRVEEMREESEKERRGEEEAKKRGEGVSAAIGGLARGLAHMSGRNAWSTRTESRCALERSSRATELFVQHLRAASELFTD